MRLGFGPTEYERRIRSGETTLAALALTESDCSSAAKGGDLGWFGPKEMQGNPCVGWAPDARWATKETLTAGWVGVGVGLAA